MRRLAWIVVPVALVGLLAIVALAARGPDATTAFTLKPGDCFDLPTDAHWGGAPLAVGPRRPQADGRGPRQSAGERTQRSTSRA